MSLTSLSNSLYWDVLTSVIFNRQFAEIYEELKQISSKDLLSRINSSADDKDKIQDCVVRIDQLVSDTQLQLHVAAHERLQQIHSDNLVSTFEAGNLLYLFQLFVQCRKQVCHINIGLRSVRAK